MKKVTYLLLVMFATVLLITSCEEDDVVTPEIPIITLEEFVGYWNFVQSEYNGETYITCEDVEDDPNVSQFKDGMIIDLDIKLVSEQYTVDFNCYVEWIFVCCEGGNPRILSCTLIENRNEFKWGDETVFKVLSYNKTTKTLKAQLIEPQGSEYSPIGLTYTWQK